MRCSFGAHEKAVRQRVESLNADGAIARIWRRDASFWGADPARQESVANRLGWLEIASKMRAEVANLESFARDVREAGFTHAVLLGMGGSSLAPEVMRQSIDPQRGFPELHVLDTTDPATILALRREIDLKRTLFIVSSKSGGTIEVASLFAYFHALMLHVAGDDAGEQFVAITDEGTSLQTLARQRGFRRTFVNASDIGGRYSALSYFGLVPAAIIGIDVGRMLDAAVAEQEASKLPGSDALQLGAALGDLALAGRDKCTFIVSAEIGSLGLWLEQLIAESTGKEGTGIVPVADEPLGTPRSYGTDRVFVQVRLEGGYTGEQDSVTGALVNEGLPAIRMDLGNAYALGSQFFRWELATAVAGHVLGINPFDEPNVQESKDNTSRVLEEFEASGAFDEAQAAPEVLTRLPDRLEPPAYFAITAYVQQTPATDLAFSEIRRLVRDATGVATTLGYGPRFLHSTGQIHKGGPPAGVFLQVVADDAEDIAIPGKAYTFGQLKRAQAIGDRQSLASRGRTVARFDLGSDVDGGLQRLVESVRRALSGQASRR